MCGKNLAFWWFCAFLFIASSSKHQLKSTSNEEINDNLTIRYELDENFMTNYSDETEMLQYDLYEKSINNTQNDEFLTSSTSNNREDDDSVQYELGPLSIKNHENDSHMPIEFRTNSTKVNSKKNSTSQEIYRDLMKIEISQPSSTSDDMKDHNSTVQYEDTKRNYDRKGELVRNNLHKNATKHNNDVQYEFHNKSTRNNRENDDSMHEFSAHFVNYPEKDNQMPMEFRANFTKADSKNNSNNENDNKNYIVPDEKCDNTCIQLCCPLGDRLVDKDCIAGEDEDVFLNVYSNDSLQSEIKKVDELFQLIVQHPCQETKHFLFNSNIFRHYDSYMFFANGSLYLPYFNLFVESTSYCLAIVNHKILDAIICLKTVNKTIVEEMDTLIINDLKTGIWSKFVTIFLGCRIVSMLCLLIIFLVYSILPELRNTHSFMLRRYSSLFSIAYMIDIVNCLMDTNEIYSICITFALASYFFYLASFFWLSVMSFDMWWTFREFRSLQRNVKQQKRKKLMYSIFAWGGPFVLTIICVFVDFVLSVPKNLRPEFDVDCWFHESTSYQLYYYGPKSICIFSSICLSIHTVLKISRYEKDTARHLEDSESRCYNDNKQWFTLYLKLYITLFIIMAINWIIITAWEFLSFNYITFMYLMFSICLMDTMQDIIIFIIFVCKKTIMRLLLKQFCQNCGSVSKTSTRNSLELHHRVYKK